VWIGRVKGRLGAGGEAEGEVWSPILHLTGCLRPGCLRGQDFVSRDDGGGLRVEGLPVAGCRNPCHPPPNPSTNLCDGIGEEGGCWVMTGAVVGRVKGRCASRFGLRAGQGERAAERRPVGWLFAFA